jgi:hypothetical protein
MSKITTIDRGVAGVIHRDLQAELDKLGARMGLKIKTGRLSYSGDSFRVTVEGNLLDTSGAGVTTKTALMMLRASGVDIDKATGVTATSFIDNPQQYVITDYNASAHKYPWIAKARNGKLYKLSDAAISRYFAKSAAAPVTRPSPSAIDATVTRMVDEAEDRTVTRMVDEAEDRYVAGAQF